MKKGFSTLEMMMALAIALVVMSAVFLVSFGNQSTVLNAQTNAEAVTIGQQLLEQQQSQAKQTFPSNGVTGGSVTSGGLTYTTSVQISDPPSTTCSDSTLCKLVTALISWLGDHGQALSVKLTTLVTDPQSGSSSCSPTLVGDWTNPRHYDFSSTGLVPGNQSNGVGVSDLMVRSKKLFVTAYAVNNSNHKFYIFSLPTDPSQAPTYVSSFDPSPSTSDGLNALALNGSYAYAANLHDSNFQTCSESSSCAQLFVVDISNTASPFLAKAYKVPSATAPFVLGNMTSTGQAVGKSIFYKDGYVYLGLTKTASGPEFIVLDAGGGGAGGTAASPKYLGSYAVGRTVNKIFIKDNYAYLATDDNNRELLILDISNKATPNPVGLFNAPGSTGFGYGESGTLSGTTFYLGRSYDSASAEFYILDASNPATSLPVLGSYDAGVPANTDSVNSVIVRSNLAFLLTNTQFGVYNVSNPGSITQYATPIVFSSFINGNGSNIAGTASNCSGNYFYIAIKTPQGQNKDDITVIIPGGVNPTLVESVHDASHNVITTTPSGTSVHAATTLSGSAGTPTGTVTYTFYTNGTCSAGTTAAGTVTVSSGFADPSTTEGPLSAGTYSFKGHYSGDINYNAFDSSCMPLTVTKADQTITVTTHAPASATYNTTFPVAATASSGLAVTITTSGVCTIAGNMVTMTSGTGTCTVNYNQAGDANYNAAPQVTDSTTATKASQTITITTHAPASAAYNSTFTVAATASSGLGISVTSNGSCSGSGTGSAVITMTTSSGTCTVSYQQAGNANYTAATTLTDSTTATKASQTITVTTHAPASAAFNSTFPVAANSSSGLGVAITTSGGCSGAGTGSATITMTSMTVSCSIFYNQAGNANYNPALQVTDTTTISFVYTFSTVPTTVPSVTRGGASVSFSIKLTQTSGAGQLVQISFSNVPNKVTITPVAGTSCNPNGTSCTVSYTVSAQNGASKATTAITVNGVPPPANPFSFNLTVN